MAFLIRRKRNTIFLDTKIDILDCLANGQGSSAVARLFDLNEATVRTIKKNEVAIRNAYSSETSSNTSSRSRTIKASWYKPPNPNDKVEVPIRNIRKAASSLSTTKIGTKLSAQPSSSSSSNSNTLEVGHKPKEHIDNDEEGPMLVLGHKEPSDTGGEESMDVLGFKEQYSDNDEEMKSIPKSKMKLKRATISLDTKVAILNSLANGQGSTAVARLFGLNEATVRTIKKNEVAIRNSCSSGTSLNPSSRSRTIKAAWDKPSNPKEVVLVPTEHTDYDKSNTVDDVLMPILERSDNDEEEATAVPSPKEHSDNGEKKSIRKSKMKPKRATIYLDTKIEILGRLAAGHGSTSVARHFGLNEATVRTIKKNEVAIIQSMSSVTTCSAQSSTYTRDNVKEKTEKVLAMWIEHNVKDDMPIHQNYIRETALRIYKKIKAMQPSSSERNTSVEFAASTGWMRRFLKRNSLSIKICTSNTAEAVNGDIQQADINEFIEGVLGMKESNDSSKEEEPILSSDIIKKALKLANKLRNHFMKHDPNKERAEKFRHDLNLLMAPYIELDKTRAGRSKTKR